MLQALLSMLYLTVSDIFALINYVGFATWVREAVVVNELAAMLKVMCLM
jgi:solute carrier family 7 L-type amino acid transporter-like protein